MIIILRLIVQAILTLLIALILYFILKHSINQIDLEKVYFPNGNKLEREQKESNQYRLNIARSYLNESQIGRFRIKSNSSVDIAISVIASYRKKRFYLTQTLGYLLHELKSSRDFSLLVCYVEENADIEIEDLQRMGIEFLFLYQNRTFPKLPFGKSDERIAKEADDYWNCLKQTNKLTRTRFVLLVEDDSLATPELLIQLNSLVDELRDGIDYVKLFHPWYLRAIPLYIQAPLLCLLLSFFIQITIPTFRNGRIFYLNSFILGFLLFAMLISQNQQLISDIRFKLTKSVYRVYAESCCTQAVLFRATSIPKMVSELSKIPARLGHAKDHILDESSFVGRMSDRNLFVHIGYYSAVRQNLVDIPQSR